MNYLGSCPCKTWVIRVSIAEPLSNLNPRVCDCDYCQAHPSAVISHPDMHIELLGDETRMTSHQNGDRLASFRRCSACDALLAVTCEIRGRLRGAANAHLIEQRAELGPQVAIQPRLLAAAEKLLRWEKLWGEVTIRASGST
jgi:hypothetical protein